MQWHRKLCSQTRNLGRVLGVKPADELAMTSAPPSSPTLDEAELGQTIRDIRKQKQLSLKELAAKSAVSVSFLSQVERGTTSPSIASLMRIAHALDRTIGSLLEPKSTSRLVRNGEGLQIVHTDGQWSEVLLTPRDFSQLQVIRSTLAPGGSTGDEPLSYSAGETSLIVASGRLTVEMDSTEIELHKGDCLSFDPAVPHRLSNRTDQPCVLHFASAPPTY